MGEYIISGTVIKGKGLGSKLGFPTANFLPLDQTVPPHGVYQTKITVEGEVYNAITNIGTNPTFGGNGVVVESHIFGMNADITGKHIIVETIKFIRGEKKFNSADELIAQIKKDIAASNCR